MTSVQVLREFINQRLTAAAGEIFTVFQQTIVQYEEEIERQRRLLEIIWQPQVKLHRTGMKKSERTRESGWRRKLRQNPPQIREDHEDPESPPIKTELEDPEIKDEEEGFSSSQMGVSHVFKFEGDTFRSEPEPHSCRMCGKRFRHKFSFMVHMQSHAGQTPFLCNTCGKSFANTSSLKNHTLTHTGERPHLCATCGKSFSLHSTLLVHMRAHTGEKPYSCDECGRSFTHHSSMLCHMRCLLTVTATIKPASHSDSAPLLDVVHCTPHRSRLP
uniref:C2H2-type domain-containing protein n=1 Tax=Salarias fasciatus TaxID=181472 RepID=A0A672HYY5_SALFA